MRFILTILFIFGLYNISFSQYNPDTDDKSEIKTPYKLNDISIHYSGAIFNFNSSYLNHIHEISDFQSPDWQNPDSTILHNNRSEFYLRLNFQKQRNEQNSSFYGNFSFGLCVATGNRLDAAYKTDYNSFTNSAVFNSESVTNLDTTIILQQEYQHKSTELGIDFTYTISSSPKPILRGEIGIGFTGLYGIIDKMIFTDSKSIDIRYIDQYSRSRNIKNLTRTNENLTAKSQLILKLYLPLIISYKLNRTGTFALSTMISGGVEFQKPHDGNFYAYPYFTIGIGARYRFK
ncbi:MAG: hypothetical protein PHP52_03655 [Bacteroidales bacterium]|nr:hypothetical protein [Bacteroidales bacterium]MDD4216521.1 hypothetical protein [Bacteroidales bacterium]MDY0141432.1 hypothetical protein [Bacteroidales bacterium]